MEKIEYCYECNKDVKVITKCEKNKYTYRNKEFIVVEDVDYCPKCNSVLLNDNLNDSMYNIYNEYLKLFNLSFNKIKEIRTNLNLSQETFSKILGWSKKSIVRYENHESIPQGEYLNTYINLNNNPYYIVKLLERVKNDFSQDEYYKILKTLPFSDIYKTVHTILYILKDNDLCETSLMKNLFVVDFYNYQKEKKSLTNLKYAHLPYGPVVDSRNNLYNFMIKNDYINIEITDFGTNFTSNIDFDNNIFTKNELENMKIIKDKLKKYNAVELSDWSHNFKGYKDTKNGQIISYKYASFLNIDEL